MLNLVKMRALLGRYEVQKRTRVMGISDIRALEVILGQIRAIHDELAVHHAGVAVLHMDAAGAALESHLRRLRAADEASSPAKAAAG